MERGEAAPLRPVGRARATARNRGWATQGREIDVAASARSGRFVWPPVPRLNLIAPKCRSVRKFRHVLSPHFRSYPPNCPHSARHQQDLSRRLSRRGKGDSRPRLSPPSDAPPVAASPSPSYVLRQARLVGGPVSGRGTHRVERRLSRPPSLNIPIGGKASEHVLVGEGPNTLVTKADGRATAAKWRFVPQCQPWFRGIVRLLSERREV